MHKYNTTRKRIERASIRHFRIKLEYARRAVYVRGILRVCKKNTPSHCDSHRFYRSLYEALEEHHTQHQILFSVSSSSLARTKKKYFKSAKDIVITRRAVVVAVYVYYKERFHRHPIHRLQPR